VGLLPRRDIEGFVLYAEVKAVSDDLAGRFIAEDGQTFSNKGGVIPPLRPYDNL